MKLLIIDDNVADRKFFRKHIEDCKMFPNIEVDECGCLTNAFKSFENKDYDLIILDLGLPESTGMDTIEGTINALKDKKRIPPIIVLTGNDDHVMGAEAFKQGIKDFLTKDDIVRNHKDLLRSIKYATYRLNFNTKKKF